MRRGLGALIESNSLGRAKSNLLNLFLSDREWASLITPERIAAWEAEACADYPLSQGPSHWRE